MSPEQCEGRAKLDGHSDVYGLGALLFEMVCGRTPFQGPPPRMMYQHVYESPPSPERFCPELRGELRVLIMRMLAKEPDSRPTMSEVAWQLRSHCKQVDLPPPTPLQLEAPRISDGCSSAGAAQEDIGPCQAATATDTEAVPAG